MTTTRILILYDHEIFGRGVYSLVKTRSDLRVIAVEPFSEDTVTRAKDFRPIIVILSESTNQLPSFLPDLLEAIPGVRVVRLTLGDNIIRVYDCHQVIAEGTEDLLAVLDSAHAPSLTGPTK